MEITTVEQLADFAFEKLKEMAVMECLTKDDYETDFESVFLNFISQMESK